MEMPGSITLKSIFVLNPQVGGVGDWGDVWSDVFEMRERSCYLLFQGSQQ